MTRPEGRSKERRERWESAVSRCEQRLSIVGSQLTALGVLLQGQGESADGLTELIGLGISLKNFGEELELVSRVLDDLGVDIIQSGRKSK